MTVPPTPAPAPSLTPGKKTKSKQKKDKAADETSAVTVTNSNSSDNSSSNSSYSSSNSSSVTRMELLQTMIQLVIKRTASFSSLLLSEAVRQLSPHVAALFLNIFAQYLDGLCTINSNSSSNSGVNSNSVVKNNAKNSVADNSGINSIGNNNSVGNNNSNYIDSNDAEVRRAIVWIESLLDGHFTSFAINATISMTTRRALTNVMEIIGKVDDAITDIEECIGLWTHVNRIVRHGGEPVRPITTLYSVETLSI